MPIDKIRPVGMFPLWMHRGVREAVSRPGEWLTMLDAVDGHETGEHRSRELTAKQFAEHSMRKFRAFRRSLAEYPLHPTSQVAIGWEFEVKLAKGGNRHHMQVLIRAVKPRGKVSLDLDGIAEQLAMGDTSRPGGKYC